MGCRKLDEQNVRALRDLAIAAVMQRGALEPSGAARLAVLRECGLMIGYRTPFNPLPKLSSSAKYEAALEGKNHWCDAYGIDVWVEEMGKVFSAGWEPSGEMRVRLCKPGSWQSTLETLASLGQPDRAVSEAPAIRARKPKQGQDKTLRLLKTENRQLRRVISGLMRDKLILAKAAAGTL